MSCVVRCPTVVVIVAAVEVVDASVELVLYVKLAKICVMVVARTKIVVIWETKKNISKWKKSSIILFDQNWMVNTNNSMSNSRIFHQYLVSTDGVYNFRMCINYDSLLQLVNHPKPI